jgi:polyol permease family
VINEDVSTQRGFSGWLTRQGIVSSLRWGFVAVTLFMVGDGLELGFLSPYLESEGFASGNVATLFTLYGITVAIASWLAGALAEAWGPRRVMLAGFICWVVLEVVFLWPGVMGHNYPIMLAAYTLRGFGYPLFSYGFLVWVTLDTPEPVLGRAVGWYWFASTLGLGTIGGYIAGGLLPVLGDLGTLWISLGFALAGGIILVTLIPKRHAPEAATAKERVGEVLRAVTILRIPKIAIGGVVRIINTLITYSFPVFFAPYMVHTAGFTESQWSTIWATMLFSNILANILAGYISDRVGRENIVAVGGVLCAVFMVLLYYVPTEMGPNYWLTSLVAIGLGAGLAGYVPLSAIMPLLSPAHKAAAVAILNLGAGLSHFVAPLLVRIFLDPLGPGGLMWLLAGIYVIGVIVTPFLKSRKSTTSFSAEASS